MAGIAAVIPAYNAEKTVGRVIRHTAKMLSPVVVVDDGSTDGTRPCAQAAGARVLPHGSNRGKGAALRTAFAALTGEPFDAIITLDADGQHDPDDIPRFVEAFRSRGADLIVGSRDGSFAAMSRWRRFGNRFSSSALAFFTGLSLPDSQSGFRLYSLPFVRSLRPYGDAYEAEMEFLLQAAQRGLKVETVPIRPLVADGRSRSHFRPWRDTCRICLRVVGFSLQRRLAGRGA